MSLQLKIILILMGFAVCYCGFDFAMQRSIYVSFDKLEKQHAQENLQRCINSINSEISRLDSLAAAWAYWDDTRNFLRTGDNAFITKNVTAATFRNNDLNMLIFTNNWGKVVWMKTLTSDLSSIQMAKIPADMAGARHPLMAPYNPSNEMDGTKRGIYMSERGPMIVAVEPILSAGGQVPYLGNIVLGKFLDEKLLTDIVGRTGINFILQSLDSNSTAIVGQSDINIVGPEMIQARHVFGDIDGKPVIQVIASLTRSISQQGQASMVFAIVSVCGAFIVLLSVLFVVLHRSVIGPITALSRHFTGMADNYDLTAKIHLNRNDEIGVLAEQFNTLVDQLEMARSIHAENSYKSGKSEMAAGLLHNLRNMFSPVISRVCLLKEKMGKISLEKLHAAKEQLKDEATSQFRKADIAEYIELVHQSIIELYKETLAEVDEIAIRAAEIEKVFSYADGDGLRVQIREKVVLSELIARSVKLIPDKYATMLDVQMADSVRQAGVFKTDPLAMAQVVANIFTNAAESILSTGRSCGTVNVTADLEVAEHGTNMHVMFADDGAGIEREKLDKVFERGFTTKNKRSVKLCGLGLHWCANTINALGGRIWVESQGPGHGACVNILLPLTSGSIKHLGLKACAV